jgi:hypothetical protein
VGTKPSRRRTMKADIQRPPCESGWDCEGRGGQTSGADSLGTP